MFDTPRILLRYLFGYLKPLVRREIPSIIKAPLKIPNIDVSLCEQERVDALIGTANLVKSHGQLIKVD